MTQYPTKRFVKKVITEELKKDDVRDMMNAALKSYAHDFEFKRSVKSIVVDVMQKYFKDMWQKNVLWANSLKS